MTELTNIQQNISKVEMIEKYYSIMLAYQQIEDVPVSFLMAISKYIGHGTGDQALIWIGGPFKKGIMSTYACARSTADKLIKQCVDQGILERTESRGVYKVVPWLIPADKWPMLKNITAELSYTGDTKEFKIKTEIIYFNDIR